MPLANNRPPPGHGGKQISFTLANVCASGLPDASADFVWGEDAHAGKIAQGLFIARKK